MLVSEAWLRKWVSPPLDTAALAERLTLAGLEVAGVRAAAPPLDQVIVGTVLSVSPHPDAERLRVCSVDVGAGAPLSIVCGAPDVAAGMRVAVAKVGAVLPDGRRVDAATIRGTASHGMLCSARELGLGDSGDGLLRLDEAARPGEALYDALALNDHVIEIELTPNRGDCLSIAGLAREIAVLTESRVKAPRPRALPVRDARALSVTLEAKEECPRYAGRVIEDLDPNALTPSWMAERLRRAGIRCIHPVVDVTHYVMLELGQPLHAFDLQKLHGGIRVRKSGEGARLRLLDGREIEVPRGSLLIGDDKGPLALAGIMGGADSAVDRRTQSVFLESAFFRPQALAKTARALGLHTDSAYRFERGVDPELQVVALERASGLILEIAGGRCGPITEARAAKYLPKSKPIVLRQLRIERTLGFLPPPKKIERLLQGLGMRLKAGNQAWRVTPPSYRFDLNEECDLIEEIARVIGYDRIPVDIPRRPMDAATAAEAQVAPARLRAILADRDYQEVVTYSFVDPDLQSRLDPTARALVLKNPIASNMAVMRTGLWPGLLDALRHNLRRQQTRVRLFEIGRCFEQNGDLPRQDYQLGLALSGAALPEQWSAPTREADFFDAKGDLEALLSVTGQASAFRFEETVHPALQAGQAARIRHGDRTVGYLGLLAHGLRVHLDLGQRVYVASLELGAISHATVPIYHEISKFPSIRRDLALLVPAALPAATVMQRIAEVAGNLLVDLQVFDEYRGEGVDSRRKSLAFALTLQDSSRTLNEEAVDAVIKKVVTVLQTEWGAELRQ